jgi:hypothetical protein
MTPDYYDQWVKQLRIQQIIDRLHEIDVLTETHWIELGYMERSRVLRKRFYYLKWKTRMKQAALVAGFLLIACSGAFAQTQTVHFNLSWTNGTPGTGNPPSGTPTGTKVERSAGSVGPWTQVGLVPWSGSTFVDTITEDPGGKIYCYRVRATNVAGDSPYSNTACGSTPAILPVSLNPPSGLTLSVTGSS